MKDTAGTVTLRSPTPGDWGWILQKHGEIFDQEFKWGPIGVPAYCAEALGEFIPKSLLPGHGAWIAVVNGTPVGSILVQKEDERTGRIRLLVVSPEARRMGVGLKLVQQCIEFSREAGFSKLTLFTFKAQKEGQVLYEKLGFRLTKEAKSTVLGWEMDAVFMERDL